MLNGFKTYLGIILAVLGGLAGSLGVEPAVLPAWANEVLVLVGGAFAWFGRWHKERRAPG